MGPLGRLKQMAEKELMWAEVEGQEAVDWMTVTQIEPWLAGARAEKAWSHALNAVALDFIVRHLEHSFWKDGQ